MGSLVWKGIKHSSPEKTAQRRRQRSASVAMGKMRTVLSQPQDQQCQLFGSILKQYLGERFDRTAGSLTAADCLGLVEANTDDPQLARKMRDLVDACEAAHYSSAHIEIDTNQIDTAIGLIKEIHRQARK
jgi:hypothetical protein